jgi:alpha-glucosidase
MLGDLLITAAAETSIYATDVQLPKGLWYDLVDGKHQKSDGVTLHGYPTYRDGVFRLPVFAKGGAIIPRYAGMMHQKALGSTNAVSLAKNMMLDVYVSEDAKTGSFDLVEDEGYSREYESGAVRVTRIEQVTKELTTNVSIAGSVGTYAGAQDSRAWTVRLWSPGWAPAAVSVDGELVPVCDGGVSSRSVTCYERVFDAAIFVRMVAGDTRLNHKISVEWRIGAPDAASVHIVCDEGRDAPRGYGMFVVGADPVLGAWNPARALPLKAAEYARGVWTGLIRTLPAGTAVEWKCLRKLPGGGDRNIEWQPGSNNVTTTTSEGGYSGMAKARW